MENIVDIDSTTLKAGEYWVRTDKNTNYQDKRGNHYELWGTTRAYNGEEWVELR